MSFFNYKEQHLKWKKPFILTINSLDSQQKTRQNQKLLDLLNKLDRLNKEYILVIADKSKPLNWFC